jgi:phosphopantothenoylcysteine decarboxylase/phosphopantothenate--cysteine ligase
MTLAGKHIVVGVGGGIAAYKSLLLVRELGRRGAELRVVLTKNALRFVGASSFAGLTGKPPVVDLFDPSYPGEVHVELSAWADALVIAPATANLLARAAHGQADDAVLATLSCCRCPVLFAPAMHERMWSQPATQRNMTQLERDGHVRVGPVTGALASGEVGMGRMAEPEAIADVLEALLAQAHDLAGLHVLVSAGPTVEDLDPVRFISNRSTGRMGFAIAAEALARGARVTLVKGPTALAPPAGAQVVEVRSALDMQAAIQHALPSVDVLVMTAAVADYRPRQLASSKLKKNPGDDSGMVVELVRNPDILAELGKTRTGKRPVLVGFAMETEDVRANAEKKLHHKRVDLVVGNEASVGFGGDDNQALLVSHTGVRELPAMSKRKLAGHILDAARALL